MKSIINNIFGITAAAFLLSVTSCSDDTVLESSVTPEEEAGNIVTFYVAPYNLSTVSRGDDDAIDSPTDSADPSDEEIAKKERETVDTPHTSFGQGSYVDMLAFSVYKQNSEGEYVLQPEFQKHSDPIGNITAGTGQNLLKVDKNEWPMEIRLALDPTANYKVVFWAQNSSSTAYDFRDMTMIKADYSTGVSPLNNDELRDAFSEVASITGYQSKVEVILHRPMAQINVGTTGWDYEGAAVLRPDVVSYTRSQITLKGVAQYYDALNKKAVTKNSVTGEDLTTDVTFVYNRIPAYVNLTDDEWDNLTYEKYDNEELLYVDLYNSDPEDPDYNGNKFYTYKTWQDYINYRDRHEEAFVEGARPLTEVFKYLSMCYVFVPSSELSKGGVINEVTFESLGKNDDEGIGEVFTVKNVPVQQNWRTNIIGDSFFVDHYQYYIDIVPTFCGDYNNIDDVWQNDISFDSSGNMSGAGDPNQGFKDLWGDDYYNLASGSSDN